VKPLPEMKYWPVRVVWARERGWLEVRDPWDGTWFQIQAKGAPSGWVQQAMNNRDPRKIAAEQAGLYSRTLPGPLFRPPAQQHVERVRIDELEEPAGRV
jgi:hypothetical protein